MNVVRAGEHFVRHIPSGCALLRHKLYNFLLSLADGAQVAIEKLFVIVDRVAVPAVDERRREADRTVLAGDCVLKRITPNPILSPDPIDASRRFRSLAEYLVSLARLRSLSPTLVYGGHGDPVEDYDELFNRYLRAVNERQSEVISLIPKPGATAWDVSLQLFPGAGDVHRFLAVSETVAHLDLAHSENKLALELPADGREIYRRA